MQNYSRHILTRLRMLRVLIASVVLVCFVPLNAMAQLCVTRCAAHVATAHVQGHTPSHIQQSTAMHAAMPDQAARDDAHHDCHEVVATDASALQPTALDDESACQATSLCVFASGAVAVNHVSVVQSDYHPVRNALTPPNLRSAFKTPVFKPPI